MKKILLVIVLILAFLVIFIHCEFNKESIDTVEEDARKTQNISEEAVLYYDECEISTDDYKEQQMKLQLLLFETADESEFVYALYRNGEFVEGGAPMIDEHTSVSVLRAPIIKNESFLIFYKGGSSADKVAFVDYEGNVLAEIDLGDDVLVRILSEEILKNAKYYHLIKANKIIQKVEM